MGKLEAEATMGPMTKLFGAAAVAIAPRIKTGHNILDVLTPAARIATSSLSLPIRPKPIIVPDNTAIGIVSTSTEGSNANPS